MEPKIKAMFNVWESLILLSEPIIVRAFISFFFLGAQGPFISSPFPCLEDFKY